jgi:hypothetical protein
MKNLIFGLFLLAFTMLSSCGGNNQKNDPKNNSKSKESPNQQEKQKLEKQKLDSINKALIPIQVPINKKFYLKPSRGNSEEIEGYLKNFELITSYAYYGKQSGNPNWQPSEGDEDPYSKYNRVISIYEHGIVFWEKIEYEGASYDLFIPMLSIIEGKNLIQNLCKNMGGCTPPEEVEVEFKEFMGGILVTWGGGC